MTGVRIHICVKIIMEESDVYLGNAQNEVIPKPGSCGARNLSGGEGLTSLPEVLIEVLLALAKVSEISPCGARRAEGVFLGKILERLTVFEFPRKIFGFMAVLHQDMFDSHSTPHFYFLIL